MSNLRVRGDRSLPTCYTAAMLLLPHEEVIGAPFRMLSLWDLCLSISKVQGAYLHAQNIATNKPDGPFIVRYHGKGKGKVYSLSDARLAVHSCLVTWKATRLDQREPYLFDDKVSRAVLDQVFFHSVRTGRVCHRVGPEFMVELYNPYHFSKQLGYIPVIPSLNSITREMVDLFTGLKSWRLCVLFRARQTVTFPGDATSNSPLIIYKTWLSKLFASKDSYCSPKRHGKGKGLPAGILSSSLVFKSSGSSKRKCSLDIAAEDRDRKHARGARKKSSSSRGSRVIPSVRSSPERFWVPSSIPLVIPDKVVKE
ncbi:hypothetical protein LIER_22715 [Lithospermum erythrorhizon]|uniref:Uncharacterized protein n=1 Tax=Lithospermum erythrorhizon TaxID=34254 RepID=A0AAV3QW41_LITER